MRVHSYLKIVLANMKRRKITGNAHGDFELLNELPAFAVVACQLNEPDLAFEALDYLGTDVMGVEDLTWEDPRDGFVATMTFWHREVWPEDDAEERREAEERVQIENYDSTQVWNFRS